MERQMSLRGQSTEESGRKPDYVGAGFAVWIEDDHVWLKDERTGKGMYLNPVKRD